MAALEAVQGSSKLARVQNLDCRFSIVWCSLFVQFDLGTVVRMYACAVDSMRCSSKLVVTDKHVDLQSICS